MSESSKSSDRRSERGRHDRRREEERRKEKQSERDGKDRSRSSSRSKRSARRSRSCSPRRSRSRSQRRTRSSSPRRSRSPRGSRSPRRSRSRSTRGPSPRGTSPTTEKFAVDREKRAMMTSKLNPSDARRLRERYVPEFASGCSDLVYPKLDSSMARRLKEMKNAEATKAEAREKSLLADQYKILDIGRPHVFLWNDLTKDQTMLDSPLAVAAASAMQLWDNSFFAIRVKDGRMTSRRLILNVHRCWLRPGVFARRRRISLWKNFF